MHLFVSFSLGFSEASTSNDNYSSPFINTSYGFSWPKKCSSSFVPVLSNVPLINLYCAVLSAWKSLLLYTSLFYNFQDIVVGSLSFLNSAWTVMFSLYHWKPCLLQMNEYLGSVNIAHAMCNARVSINLTSSRSGLLLFCDCLTFCLPTSPGFLKRRNKIVPCRNISPSQDGIEFPHNHKDKVKVEWVNSGNLLKLASSVYWTSPSRIISL